jgi:hypothetical protein
MRLANGVAPGRFMSGSAASANGAGATAAYIFRNLGKSVQAGGGNFRASSPLLTKI